MKILIISQNSFPKQEPRAFRTAELSEYLAKMGHNVVLYTVHGKYDYSDYEKRTGVIMKDIKPMFAVYRNDGTQRYNLFDKLMYHSFRNLFFWPYCEFHFTVDKIIKENPNMDLLITIAYPHSIHSGAARAKQRNPEIFPQKWICDCGDPFMLNPFFRFPKYLKKFEDLWCSLCDYITVPTANSKSGYYKQYWDKIRVIPQGFDFTKTPIAEYKKNAVPTFLFMGRIYSGIRDPHSFMEFLLTYKKPYKFIMMLLEPLEEKYIIESNGQIEYVIGKKREEVIWECSKADFLINIVNPNSVQTPSKLIDYGISKRPILNVSNNFDSPEIFEEFMVGDYKHRHILDSIDSYRIENVANEFIKLTENHDELVPNA